MRIYEAVEKLLKKCDGAKRQDGEGFNKYDRHKVDNIMIQEKNADNEIKLKNIISKYTNTQLEGINLETEYSRTALLDEYDIVLEKKEYGDKKIDDLINRFDYDEDIIETLKNSIAQFNKKTDNWHAPFNKLDEIRDNLKEYEVYEKLN